MEKVVRIYESKQRKQEQGGKSFRTSNDAHRETNSKHFLDLSMLYFFQNFKPNR